MTARIFVAVGALGATIAAAALGACALEPDVGPLLAGTCDNADTNPAVNVSFSNDIRPIFNQMVGGCSCHMSGANGVGQGTALSGLNLSSLTALRAGGVHSGTQIVVDGQPCASILFQKVSDAPPYGSRMPLGGPYLSQTQLALIHDWIAEGAADN